MARRLCVILFLLVLVIVALSLTVIWADPPRPEDLQSCDFIAGSPSGWNLDPDSPYSSAQFNGPACFKVFRPPSGTSTLGILVGVSQWESSTAAQAQLAKGVNQIKSGGRSVVATNLYGDGNGFESRESNAGGTKAPYILMFTSQTFAVMISADYDYADQARQYAALLGKAGSAPKGVAPPHHRR